MTISVIQPHTATATTAATAATARLYTEKRKKQAEQRERSERRDVREGMCVLREPRVQYLQRQALFFHSLSPLSLSLSLSLSLTHSILLQLHPSSMYTLSCAAREGEIGVGSGERGRATLSRFSAPGQIEGEGYREGGQRGGGTWCCADGSER